MAFTLPALPFAPDALEPYVSARTFEFHHGKHHRAYVDKTNELIAGTPWASADLVTVVREANAKGEARLASQAGQVWNHDFFWRSLAPTGGGRPTGRIAELIERDLGGYESFVDKFKTEALGHFGSGWASLVLRGDKLEIVSLHDGGTPLAYADIRPLITLDVWEHAYYLDYQNARATFVDAFLRHLVNWDFANRNLDGGGAERANQAPVQSGADSERQHQMVG